MGLLEKLLGRKYLVNHAKKDAEYLEGRALASMNELGVTPEQIRTVLGYQRNRDLIGRLLLAQGPERDEAMLEFKSLPDAQRAIVGGAYSTIIGLVLSGETGNNSEPDLPTEVL